MSFVAHDDPVQCSYLHLSFQVILQHSVEFLHIVLHKGIQRVPSKGLCQFSSAYEMISPESS